MVRVTKSGPARTEVVRFDNLNVVIMRDGEHWFAQALEVDYAAQGRSAEDAKARFEAGLMATVDAHLQAFNGVSNLLKFAPDELWNQITASPEREGMYSYSHLSIHQLPFKKIQYVELNAA